MRICHVLAPGTAGGLESVVRMLAEGQVAQGHAVQVVATLDQAQGENDLLTELQARGVTVKALRIPGRGYLRESREMRAAFQESGPDVVHTHGYRADVVGGWVARGLKIATVSTVHGFTGGGWKNRLYEGIQVAAFRRFDAVVAVSGPLKRNLETRGVPSSRLTLLPNAFAAGEAISRREARAVLGLPEEAAVIGWVGRLSREKGADVMVEALPSLLDLPISVSFVGDGAERSSLESLAARLGVTARIRWHGIVPGAGRLASAFDLFVLSSRTEGTPIALFEAMGAGTPVVATAVGGVPDVISSQHGWLVEPESPARLAAAIREAWGSPEVRRLRSEAAARRLEEHYALEPWLNRYQALYQTLADRRAGTLNAGTGPSRIAT